MVGEKTLLYESDLLAIGATPVRDYLFRSRSGLIQFVEIEEEMSQLNDFCHLFLVKSFQKVEELREETENFDSGKEKLVDPNFGDVSSNIVWYNEDFLIPMWNDTYDFVARANCIIMLTAFLERSLKSLCLCYSRTNRTIPEK